MEQVSRNKKKKTETLRLKINVPMFQSWNVPPGIRAALRGEAQRQEQMNTGDRPLGTELIRTTTSCDEDTLSEWILQTNMAGDTSNRVRRSSRKPPPPRPHGVGVYRTQSSGLVFDPAAYHRGTEHSGTGGHRVFIQLATGTTGHGALLKANKLTAPWNLPVGMRHMTGHECKDDDARDIHCIKASQESGAAHPDP